MRPLLPYLVFVLFIFACKNEADEPTKVKRAYYYWKADFDMTTAEQKILTDSLEVERLYLKYFDVVWDKATQAAKPVASLVYTKTPPPDIEIVPTVFITNETFLEISDSAVLVLAAQVATKIQDKNKVFGIMNPVREWQFDCDWSGKTKEKYFLFLSSVQQRVPAIKLSATIRLYQVKYPKKAGVPPVSRGVLMLYNMDKVSNRTTRNSILDIGVTKTYIHSKSTYPLPLDLALPVFAWAVAFKGNEMVGLLNNITEEDLLKYNCWKKETKNNYFCQCDTVQWGKYWRVGDYLRLEQGNMDDIAALKPLTTGLRAKDSLNIVLYHWDMSMYRHYTPTSILDIYKNY